MTHKILICSQNGPFPDILKACLYMICICIQNINDSNPGNIDSFFRLCSVISYKQTTIKNSLVTALHMVKKIGRSHFKHLSQLPTSTYDLNSTFVLEPFGVDSAGVSGKITPIGIGQLDCGLRQFPELMRYWVDRGMCILGFLGSVTPERRDIWKKV